MGNIKISSEQIEQLRLQFLSDRRLATLRNEIAAIYNTAIPKGFKKEDGSFGFIYDEKTEAEVDRVKMIIAQIIEADYIYLFE